MSLKERYYRFAGLVLQQGTCNVACRLFRNATPVGVNSLVYRLKKATIYKGFEGTKALFPVMDGIDISLAWGGRNKNPQIVAGLFDG